LVKPEAEDDEVPPYTVELHYPREVRSRLKAELPEQHCSRESKLGDR
jgi:hypothetical protein